MKLPWEHIHNFKAHDSPIRPGRITSSLLIELMCGSYLKSIPKANKSCSVSCCKKHKEQCAPKAEPRPQPTSQETSQRTASMNNEGRSWSVDDILTEDDEDDKVPLQKLRLLGESEELKGLLLNPHLGQLLLTVDQAKDKSAILKTYMQEPLFVEFADCCLRIVEPPEKENARPE
ncbi:zinc finger HIT domain-containing protein 3 isoform X2 [Podarcis muralis]